MDASITSGPLSFKLIVVANGTHADSVTMKSQITILSGEKSQLSFTLADQYAKPTIRNLTANMMCMHCATVQPAAHRCTNPACGLPVSRYYCGECKLWDDDPRKNIYHCYDCGICRIGKGLGQDYFHCKKCNVCMAISLKGKHKCIERNLESDCPICGEYMFTSTTTVIFMVSIGFALLLVF